MVMDVDVTLPAFRSIGEEEGTGVRKTLHEEDIYNQSHWRIN